MAEPTIKVEIAFDNSPSDPTPRWVDVTQYVQGIESKMGRNSELDQIDAGTTDLTLDNSDGLFTPRPIPPNIVPRASVEDTLLPGDSVTSVATYARTNAYPLMFGGRSGEYIAQMTATSTTPIYFLRPIKPTPGKWVCVEGWLANDSPITCGLYLQVTVGGTSSYPGTGYAARPFYAGQFVSFVTQIPAAYDKVSIEVATNGTIAAGNRVWWDGLSVREFDSSAEAYAYQNRVQHIRPRCPARVTATFNGTTYPIAYGIIERWPMVLDNSDATQVQIVDMTKPLNDIKFGNSDTAMIARLKPIDYFPMQESNAPLFSMTSKRTLNPAWDGAQAKEKAQDDNPLPVITYGADSNLPSGSGTSVDIGEFWSQQ